MKIKKIAIIGLGYVGLPLAIEFGKSEMLLVLISIKKELICLEITQIQLLKLLKKNSQRQST